jgi:adenine-specific DNA methylase
LPEKKNIESYVRQIDHAISPQAHTAMYLMHKYWARKPHNVVGEYIEHYSKKGEIVLDPFLGSGVSAIEALKRGRKAVAIDINPLSTFLTRMTVKPIDLVAFKNAYKQLETSVKQEIEQLYTTTCPRCGKPSLEAYAIWSDIIECGECHEKVLYSKANKKEKMIERSC